MQELISDTLKSVWRHQKVVTANLSGNAFLFFLVYAWNSVMDRTTGELLFSLLVLLAGGLIGAWLHATTMASFQGEEDVSPFMPTLRRLHLYLPWAAALAATAVLFWWMSSVLSLMVWVAGVGTMLAILPLACQAAGGVFSRRIAYDIIFNEKYWLASTGLLVAGLYLPFQIMLWIPRFEESFFNVIVAGFRIGISYLLAVLAWVTLIALIGRLGLSLRDASVETGATTTVQAARNSFTGDHV